VPLVIVAIVVLAWLLLAGLPFGGREDRQVRTTSQATETIAEGSTTNAPAQSGTVINLPGDDVSTTDTIAPAGSPNTDTTATTMIGVPSAPNNTAPPAAAPQAATPSPVFTPSPAPAQQPRAMPATPQPRPAPPPRQSRPAAPAPQPRIVVTRPPASNPSPVRVPPPPPPPAQSTPAPGQEISEGAASATLRGYVGGFYREVSGDCLEIRGHGYRNVGYTFSVWNACNEGGGSRMLGRWRVDSKTREVFRQREDGRYLRP
jgi:outer membrane biosynthesis protein TonB